MLHEIAVLLGFAGSFHRASLILVLTCSMGLYGQISFGPSSAFLAPNNIQGMVTADFNQDGFSDVAVTDASGNLSIFLGLGNGKFLPPVTTTFNAARLIVADLNGDGLPDIAGICSNTPCFVLNTGHGNFSVTTMYLSPLPEPFATSIAAGDFDLDGRIDLAVVSVFYFGAAPYVTIFRNAGNAIFTAVSPSIALPDGGAQVVATDVNQDGAVDLITANGNVINEAATYSVLINNKNGTFAPAKTYVAPSGALSAADLNGDGFPDLILANNGGFSVILNQNGTFGSPPSFTSGTPSVSPAVVADFDGDGHPDLAVPSVSQVSVFRGHGDGTFDAPVVLSEPTLNGYIGPIAAADFNGNCTPDLIETQSSSNSFLVRLNLAPPKCGPGATPPSILGVNYGGNTGTVTISIFCSGCTAATGVDLSAAGKPDIVASTVSLLPASPNVLVVTLNLTGASPGVYNVVLTEPGGTVLTLPSAFTVQQGGRADVWLDFIGWGQLRAGVPQQYFVVYGNRGNIDAVNMPLRLSFPNILAMDIEATVLPPPSIGPSLGIDWTQVPITVNTSNSSLTHLMISSMPPGATGILPVTLQAPNNPSLAHAHPQSCATIGLPEAPEISDYIPAYVNAVNGMLASLGVPNPGPGSNCIKALQSFMQSTWQAETNNGQNPLSLHSMLKDLVSFAAYLLNCLGQGYALEDLLAAAYSWVDSLYDALELIDSGQSNNNLLRQFCGTSEIITSGDPNDKTGSQGVGPQQYISGTTPLRYAIQFGNESTATAPAQKVIITDQLSAANEDLSTFTLGPISVPNQFVSPPAVPGGFSTTLDLRPATNLLLAINANLSATGLVTWTFQSLDPATNQPPTDPSAGFLPPGASGSVFFTVTPKASVATGTQVQNQATVVFDANPPMSTPVWTNTIDNSNPLSHVSALPGTSSCPSFRVNWSGSDVGSGLAAFTIYVSDAGGPFTAWLSNTTAASAVYTGAVGHSYSFYSIATDFTGNVESTKTTAEASTAVTAGGPCGNPSLSGQVLSSSLSGTTLIVTLQLTNTGFTAAQAVNISQIAVRALSGTGAVTVASPTLPDALGPLAIGASTTVTLALNIPATATRISLTESGNLLDGSGNNYNYSIAQVVIP